MICQHSGRTPRRKNLAARLLVGVSASTPFVLGSVSLSANADTEPKPTNSIDHGNGTRNRNIFSMKSPTHNRGYQHTSTSTAGGRTSVQNALCRHVTVCNIRQIVIPKKGKQPTSEVRTPPPERADPPPPPATAPPVMGPFMYIGPWGLVMALGGDAGGSG